MGWQRRLLPGEFSLQQKARALTLRLGQESLQICDDVCGHAKRGWTFRVYIYILSCTVLYSVVYSVDVELNTIVADPSRRGETEALTLFEKKLFGSKQPLSDTKEMFYCKISGATTVWI